MRNRSRNTTIRTGDKTEEIREMTVTVTMMEGDPSLRIQKAGRRRNGFPDVTSNTTAGKASTVNTTTSKQRKNTMSNKRNSERRNTRRPINPNTPRRTNPAERRPETKGVKEATKATTHKRPCKY